MRFKLRRHKPKAQLPCHRVGQFATGQGLPSLCLRAPIDPEPKGIKLKWVDFKALRCHWAVDDGLVHPGHGK